MSSITYWNRLEPRPRATDLAEALAARIADPAWLLARQWQLGEFRGEDAGGPAYVKIEAKLGRVRGWGAPGASAQALAATAPVEAQVTAEPGGDDLAHAVELGQTFELFLAQASAPDLRSLFLTAYPLGGGADDEPRAARLRALWQGRAIDGLALWVATTLPMPPAPAGVPQQPQPRAGVPWTVPADRRAAAGLAVQAFVAWVRSTGVPGVGAPAGWSASELASHVRVYADAPAGGTLSLTATPDRRGDLDWYAFDGVTASAPAGTPTGVVETITRSMIPGPVRFRGMPNERFWDFEDARFPIDLLRPDRRSLASMILLDFMLVHGNDWYLVPFEQPVGSACAATVAVVDVFGTTTVVPRAEPTGPSGPGRFAMFAIDLGSAGLAGVHLVTASAATSVQESEPLEQVRFLRDEQANLVWAVEHATVGALGAGRRAADDARATAVVEPPLPEGAALRYRVQSAVPANWFPLQPVKLGGPVPDEIALELAGLLAVDGDGTEVRTPRGRILARPAPGSPLRVREEQVPREGTRVSRIVRRARGTDGASYVWVARTRGVGTGEGSAGLRYDRAIDPSATTR